MEKIGLRGRRPHGGAGSFAIAITGPVKHDHPISLGRQREQAAGLEILYHAAVSVQQHERLALAPFYIMQPHPFDIAEASRWRMFMLCLAHSPLYNDGRRGKEGRRSDAGA